MEERKEIKEMTVEQLLRLTIDQLCAIPISIKDIETIGVPIRQSISNIQACIQAMKNGPVKKEEIDKEELQNENDSREDE